MTEQARRLMKNYYRKDGQPDFPPIMVVMIHGSDRDDEGTQSSILKRKKRNRKHSEPVTGKGLGDQCSGR